MPSLSSVLRALPFSVRAVRGSERRVRHYSSRIGVGLTPLTGLFDELLVFLDWFEGHLRAARLRGVVYLMRLSERYDAFHGIVGEIASRRSQLDRLSTTFTPIQRGRYRPLLAAMKRFEAHLSTLDDLLGYLVRHPQEVTKRLSRTFAFTMRVQGMRCYFDPSGAMLFGDGMESYIDRIFELGPYRFKRSVRSFITRSFEQVPPGALAERSRTMRISITSVSAPHSITQDSRVVLSINTMDFIEAYFADDTSMVCRFLEGAREEVVNVEDADDRILITVQKEAVSAMLDVWKKRELTREYAGVLSVEKLELPSHTGSFANADEFISYAELRVSADFASYLARDIGLHIAWILYCDRMAHYQPISTSAIKELSGRRNAQAVFTKVLSEIRSYSGRDLIYHYARACNRLTRAPLIRDPRV